jgi:hypothetical protein
MGVRAGVMVGVGVGVAGNELVLPEEDVVTIGVKVDEVLGLVDDEVWVSEADETVFEDMDTVVDTDDENVLANMEEVVEVMANVVCGEEARVSLWVVVPPVGDVTLSVVDGPDDVSDDMEDVCEPMVEVASDVSDLDVVV